jgi:uncharacterized cupredoxin-like copper-binding protein
MRKILGRVALGLAVVVPSLVLAACGGGGSSQAAGETINVTLSEYKIAASQTTFKTGVKYHFVVKNAGQGNHELMLMPASDDTGGMDGMGHMGHDALYTISVNDLPPGATRDFDYTFTQQGQPEFACHVGDHYQMGMHLPLTVSNR